MHTSELYLNLESKIPVDYIVYTPESWLKHSGDTTSFDYLINSITTGWKPVGCLAD